MKPIRLVLIPGRGSEPAPYLVVADGEVRERGVLQLDALERPEPLRTVVVVPGADVTLRWLDLPAGGAAQQQAAALWMLKDALAAPSERLAVALGPIPAANQPRLVAVVGLSLLQAWTDYLDALGLRADVIIPDVLTVLEPDEEDRLNAVAFGCSLALRGRRFAASVQPDLAELVAGSRRVTPVEAASDVEAALIAAAQAPPINLLGARGRGDRVGRRGWALAAGLAGLLIVSPLVLTAAAAARDEAAARNDVDQTRLEIARVAPDLASAPDPVAALRQRVRAAPPPGGVVGVAAALFTAIEAVEGAELDLLILDPESGMKASITHVQYQDSQAIAAAMRAYGLPLTETGTLNDRGGVVSDFLIGAAR